ncbi:MAG TPA: DUF1287 domain-containing protein [Blastocatellia bacterium]
MNAKKTFRSLLILCFIASMIACQSGKAGSGPPSVASSADAVPVDSPKVRTLIDAAIAQTEVTRYYDPAYVKIPYPGGDVPAERGVCTDVVIRAFRKTGVDLQKDVHEDMASNFSAYPNKWGLNKPDTNIDHRRVPNLMTFFKRKGKAVAITNDAKDYRPGDIVAWDLGGGVLHIGVATNVRADGERLKFVHNIGWGARLEDILFSWKIIGHYRYY